MPDRTAIGPWKTSGILLWIAALVLLPGSNPDSFAARGPSVKYKFTKDDFVIPQIDPSMRLRYIVGEPVVVPLRLINHTAHALSLETNYNLRDRFTINIRRANTITRNFHGINRPGIVSPLNIFLYPLDEYTTNYVIWGDLEEPSGLAFPDPGEYIVSISQRITIPEAEFEQEFKIGTATIHIDPAPAALKPFLDDVETELTDKSLPSIKPAFYLQVQKTPPGWSMEKMDGYIELCKNTPLLPYLYLAAADGLQLEWQTTVDPIRSKSLADKALKYYQLAAESDSAYKIDAYSSLLKYEDRLGLSQAAADTARKLLKNIPDYLRGRFGGSKMLDKYLINTGEIDPVLYWWLFP